MKNIIYGLILCFLSTSINAQTSELEAISTYQIAQEEYDKGNYKMAVEYLEKVFSFDNSNALIKASYLLAKTLERGYLFADTSTLSSYNWCINAIDYYLTNGKDESKKIELMKVKIRIENDEYYKLEKQIANLSITELQNLLRTFIEPDTDKQSYMLLFYCNGLRLIEKKYAAEVSYIKGGGWQKKEGGEVHTTLFLYNDTLSLFFKDPTRLESYNKQSFISYKNYDDITKRKRIMDEDVENWLKGTKDFHFRNQYKSKSMSDLENRWFGYYFIRTSDNKLIIKIIKKLAEMSKCK